MIATREHSYGALSELELDGYCDFGVPVGHIVARESRRGPPPDLRATQLDAVIRAFGRVFDGRGDIVTARLLAACRAHLALLLRAGGAALRLVAMDLESNLCKAEALVRTAPRECRTLTSLLALERRRDVHRGNRLRDASAAMGLLWIRRSLAFQAHLYAAAFAPAGGRAPREAAAEAYAAHLSPYHGWLLRRVFPTSFAQMPARDACIAAFGEVAVAELDPERDSTITRKVRALTGTLEPLLAAWKESFERLDLEDTRRV